MDEDLTPPLPQADTPGWRPPDQPPDWARSRIRTAAQALWGFLWALLARWAADRAGIHLPTEIPAELETILSGAAVGLFAAAWMWVVSRLAKVWPTVERVFILKGGAPVYPGQPVLSRRPPV